jgi:parallel beta-helix repeat protein
MNASHELLAPAAERLGWALIHSLWQGAIIALVLAITLRVLRSYSAAARHAACLLALLTMLTTVLVTAALVSPEASSKRADIHSIIPASTASGFVYDTNRLEPASEQVETSTSIDTGVALPDLQASEPGKSWRDHIAPVLPWIAGAWIFGVVLLSIRHFGGWWRVHQLRRAGSAITGEIQQAFNRLVTRFGLQRSVKLLQSADAFTPMLTGVLKPMIILPARVLTGLGPVEIEAILAHELAHLVRRDAWSNLAQVIIETVLFYHPAVWWISRRARLEREHAADDLALKMCTDRRVYAGALMRLAELDVEPTFALAATGGHLLTRIRRILAPSPIEAAPGSLSFSVPATIATLVLATVLGSRAVAEDPPIIVAPGESIQAAIDKAPPDAVIRLREGEWKERIVIAKPLTIEGAGWEKTTIKPDQPLPGATPEARAEFRKRYTPGLPEAEVAKLNQEWSEKFEKPTLLVQETGKVTVRGVRIGGAFASRAQMGNETLIVFRKAQGTLIKCAAIGPFANGVQLADQSDIEIRQSFIGALWGEGIVVRGRSRTSKGEPSRLRLIESEVRNVYHYGVAIGPGCDSTVVERCRISGTAWHGIRYDDASPTIIGNVIFQNARSGIYASGKTQAAVRENLFWKNEMDGISCWFDNTDTIENNTFVGNLREGLAVIGGSKPNVSRNIFIGNPTAIVCSMTRGSTAAGDPVLSGNLFFDNKVVLQVKEESKPAPQDSVNADPKFRDPDSQDFTPGVALGATKPLIPTGPWPLLAEEKAIIPADDTREYNYWTEPGVPKKSKAAAPPSVRLISPQPEKAEIEVQWEGKWWPATVLRKEGDRTQIHYVGYGSKWDEWVTADRIRPLGSGPANDGLSRVAPESAAELVQKNRQAARTRAAQDTQYYNREQLAEIETLYQVANTKGKRSEEAKTNLKILLEKYDKSNRTGCGVLYLGQASEGDERLRYLTTAVEKYGDCYYFNGCQVGGYGRYLLALTLWDRGEKEKARAVLTELKTTYKDTTGHNGNRMGDVADAMLKEFERTQ